VSPNVAASVRQRLLNQAHAENRPFDEFLQRFALERFLYRLAQSPYARQFVLKGALMLSVWQGAFSRPTRDVDLLGHLASSVEHLVTVMTEICEVAVPQDDGLQFHTEQIHGEPITAEAEYQGVRVHLAATLAAARINFHVDVGFGDIVIPGPTMISLPVLLDFAAPMLQGYSRESVVAEKFHAMVVHGEINSRMKDFYDIWSLARHFAFDGALLARAIHETFEHRETAIPATPVALTPAFADAADKRAQWQAFIRRQPLDHEPPTLAEVVELIAVFLQPVAAALAEHRAFEQRWLTGGPWGPPA
jgi:predicted nucleotidyltransferase component of viral defense system